MYLEDVHKLEHKSVNKDANFRHNYGISLAKANAILEQQGTKCYICGKKLNKFSSIGSKQRGERTPHMDHDHSPGRSRIDAVRGVLCRNCNWGLGHFKDNRIYLANAIRYLAKFHKP